MGIQNNGSWIRCSIICPPMDTTPLINIKHSATVDFSVHYIPHCLAYLNATRSSTVILPGRFGKFPFLYITRQRIHLPGDLNGRPGNVSHNHSLQKKKESGWPMMLFDY